MHKNTKAILNIGLHFSIAGRSTSGKLTASGVLHDLYPALEEPTIRILHHEVHQSDTEQTLVVQLDGVPARWKVHFLAEKLWQDCIAVYHPQSGDGLLLGPQPWGEFDPAQFILPGGERLGSQLLTVVPTGIYAGQRFTNPQVQPLNADTANFADFGDRNKLATLGIFAIDTTARKAVVAERRAKRLQLEGAYRYLGLTRKAESARIQGEVAGLLPEGIWPRSSKLYSSRMHALDEHVLQHAARRGYAF